MKKLLCLYKNCKRWAHPDFEDYCSYRHLKADYAAAFRWLQKHPLLTRVTP